MHSQGVQLGGDNKTFVAFLISIHALTQSATSRSLGGKQND